jgi:hypothetical protein
MDLYHIWADLAPGMSDLEFARAIDAYLGRVDDLAQLDRAFQAAATRAEPIEGAHHAVNHMVRNACFALYRDFPDPMRVAGQERF